jgi:Fe-S cluster biogenesis protein NfuA
MAGQNLRASGDRIEQLLDDLHAGAGPGVYDKVEELLRLVTDLYGAGLARIMELAGADSPGLVDQLAADELVASLLLVHELHPTGLRARVEGALAKVRPLLESHGGDVELIDIDPSVGAVRLRLLGSCGGCPSSSITLQQAVEVAVVAAAPEIRIIDVDTPPPEGVDTPVNLGAKPVYDTCPADLAAP